MEHVEQQWLEKEGVLVEPFKVEALEALKGECVFDVVEQRIIGPALHPTVEVLRQRPWQDVRESE